MLSWCWSVLYPAHKFWRKSGQNGPKCNILWINHDKYPPNCLKNCQEQDSSHFFFNHSSVVVELDVAVRLVLVEVAVEVSHTSDFYGRYLFWGEDLHEKNWAKNVLVRWGCRVFRNCCSLWRQRRATSGLNNWWMENEVQCKALQIGQTIFQHWLQNSKQKTYQDQKRTIFESQNGKREKWFHYIIQHVQLSHARCRCIAKCTYLIF